MELLILVIGILFVFAVAGIVDSQSSRSRRKRYSDDRSTGNIAMFHGSSHSHYNSDTNSSSYSSSDGGGFFGDGGASNDGGDYGGGGFSSCDSGGGFSSSDSGGSSGGCSE